VLGGPGGGLRPPPGAGYGPVMGPPPAAPSIPPPAGELWVFAYGSLMWDPGFPHDEARHARLHGYHRALCVWSWRYRGTPARPGLVLGLDRGGCCTGIAYHVPPGACRDALAYLAERELQGGVYLPLYRPVRLAGGVAVEALAFVVRRDHPQYAGQLSTERAARTVRGASGRRGPNVDYVANTVTHLERMGMPCRRLRRVLDALLSAAPGGAPR